MDGGQRCIDEKHKGVVESIQYASMGEIEKFAKIECRKHHKLFGYPAGSVFITDAPNMKTKHIVHAVTMRFPGSKAHIKTIEKLVPKILKIAEYMRLETVAIPMLGYGTGRLSENKVMKIYEQYFGQSKGNTAYIKKIIDSKEKHPATKPSVIRVSYFMLTR